MYKKITVGILALAFILPPSIAVAHERQLFSIGGADYLLVVGSLNEPLVVDDKSGVEFRVVEADPKDPTNASASGVKPLLGLETAIKVEISAGDKKKTFDLTTIYGTPGGYKAVFFPTIKTALTYRFTGSINNTPIDLSFVCAPEGSKAVEDKSTVEISAGVKRIYKNGQFGCPLGKEELGFPEGGMTFHGMHENVHGEMGKMMNDMKTATENDTSGVALVLGLIGTILGGIALVKSRTSKV